MEKLTPIQRVDKEKSETEKEYIKKILQKEFMDEAKNQERKSIIFLAKDVKQKIYSGSEKLGKDGPICAAMRELYEENGGKIIQEGKNLKVLNDPNLKIEIYL